MSVIEILVLISWILHPRISGIELKEWVIPNHFALKSILILDAAILAYVQVKIELKHVFLASESLYCTGLY